MIFHCSSQYYSSQLQIISYEQTKTVLWNCCAIFLSMIDLFWRILFNFLADRHINKLGSSDQHTTLWFTSYNYYAEILLVKCCKIMIWSELKFCVYFLNVHIYYNFFLKSKYLFDYLDLGLIRTSILGSLVSFQVTQNSTYSSHMSWTFWSV